MTEDEATNKTCPMRSRWIDWNGVSAFREAFCTASECMMWRWDLNKYSGEKLPKKEWSGHCGLAR